MQRRLCAFSMAMIIVAVSMSGCLFSSDDRTSSTDANDSYVSIFDRHTLEWKNNHTFSYTLEEGPYFALDVEEVDIDVDTSDIWETGPATSSVHLSYWLPSNTLEGENVPVIAIISPYFSYGA